MPRRGATFRVLLPAAEEAKPREAGGQMPLPTGSGHVLVVDDEPAIVDISKEMLEGLGYTVDGRTSPVDGLELFRAAPDRFYVVLTDQTMPTHRDHTEPGGAVGTTPSPTEP